MASDWFNDVENSGGSIKEIFDQKTIFAQRDAGKMCVPLSIFWVRYSMKRGLARSSSSLSNYLSDGKGIKPRLRLRLQSILNDSKEKVDKLLDVFIDRTLFITLFAYRIRIRAPEKFDNDMIMFAQNIWKFRPPNVENWPDEMFQINGIEIPDRRKEIIPMLEEINLPEERAVPWNQLIKYDFVNDCVKLFSDNSLSHKDDKIFTTLDNCKDALNEGYGYRLLIMYLLKTNKDGTLRKFEGHMMAMNIRHNGNTTFFDPQYGIANFTEKDKFLKWYNKNLVSQFENSFYSGAILKLFQNTHKHNVTT